MKFYFFIAATLWGYLPIIGWFKGLDYRLNWAMASNVLIFEKTSGFIGIRRCVELRKELKYQNALRTLFTIPSLLPILCLLFASISISLFDDSMFYWVSFAAILIIFIPLSAVVNTLVYLDIPGVNIYNADGKNVVVKLNYEDYCPTCRNYSQKSGICVKLSINVKRYPDHFQSECNLKYYQQL